MRALLAVRVVCSYCVFRHCVFVCRCCFSVCVRAFVFLSRVAPLFVAQSRVCPFGSRCVLCASRYVCFAVSASGCVRCVVSVCLNVLVSFLCVCCVCCVFCSICFCVCWVCLFSFLFAFGRFVCFVSVFCFLFLALCGCVSVCDVVRLFLLFPALCVRVRAFAPFCCVLFCLCFACLCVCVWCVCFACVRVVRYVFGCLCLLRVVCLCFRCVLLCSVSCFCVRV